MHRGSSEKLIVKSPHTRRPADWHTFLMNDDNKKQLSSMIYQVWSDDTFAHKLVNRKIIMILEGQAILLTSCDGLST